MTRFLAVLFGILIFAASFPAYADRDTGNMDSDGYYYDDDGLQAEEWGVQYTECEPCQPLMNTFNSTMDALLSLRFVIYNTERLYDQYKGQYESRRHENRNTEDKNKELSAAELRYATDQLNAIEAMEAEYNKLPALRQREKELTATAKKLAKQLDECEKQCIGKGTEKKETWTDPAWTEDSLAELPFAWKGPYAEGCFKCVKLAARLNELPGLAANAMAQRQNALLKLEYAEQKIDMIKLSSDFTGYVPKDHSPEETKKWEKERAGHLRERLRAEEANKKAAEDLIKKLDADLANYTRNFNQTLDLYNKCLPTCEKQTGMLEPEKDDTALALGGDYKKDLKGSCAYADLPAQFVIGDNSEFGSGAAMKDKAEGMAKGAAMGALNSVIGGSGISLGGGGGGGDKGPPTDRDPTKGDWTRFGDQDVDLGYRYKTDGNELLLSEKIFDSAGDGTFHAVFLQDGAGNTVTPRKYWIYSLYQDWKLTVWWTYDRWVDGEHVEHDEGEEVTTGRNNLGSWKVYDNAENGIWSKLGFGTAAKGIQGLGTSFDISKLNLSCPLKLTTFVTQPKLDPVVAIPVSASINVASSGAAQREVEDKAKRGDRLGREGHRAYKPGNARTNQ